MDRYERQIGLDNFSELTQKRLNNAKVLIVGAGGTGANLSEILTRMGFGYIRIVDKDEVSLSNLHRQFVYTENDIGTSKLDILCNYLRRVNSGVEIDCHNILLDKNNFAGLTHGIELIIDAVDNINTKLLINRLAVENKIPLIFSSVSSYYAQAMFINAGGKPCVSCLIGENYVDFKEQKVYPPVVGILANLIASLAVKFFNKEDFDNFYTIDLLNNTLKSRKVVANLLCYCGGY